MRVKFVQSGGVVGVAGFTGVVCVAGGVAGGFTGVVV